MPVRSKRLFGPVNVGTGNFTVYTCPAGETALLKDITIFNQAAVTNVVALRLNGNTQNQTIEGVTVGGGGSVVLSGRFIVLHPGDTLRVQATVASINITGYGAELEGIAD